MQSSSLEIAWDERPAACDLREALSNSVTKRLILIWLITAPIAFSKSATSDDAESIFANADLARRGVLQTSIV